MGRSSYMPIIGLLVIIGLFIAWSMYQEKGIGLGMVTRPIDAVGTLARDVWHKTLQDL
jgi:hypothetical protein